VWKREEKGQESQVLDCGEDMVSIDGKMEEKSKGILAR
jgi:hypothetical protein